MFIYIHLLPFDAEWISKEDVIDPWDKISMNKCILIWWLGILRSFLNTPGNIDYGESSLYYGAFTFLVLASFNEYSSWSYTNSLFVLWGICLNIWTLKSQFTIIIVFNKKQAYLD
jgi:hypothetical protein